MANVWVKVKEGRWRLMPESEANAPCKPKAQEVFFTPNDCIAGKYDPGAGRRWKSRQERKDWMAAKGMICKESTNRKD